MENIKTAVRAHLQKAVEATRKHVLAVELKEKAV